MSHDGVLVVGSKSVVPGQPNGGGHAVIVVLAVSSLGGGPGGVGPVILGHVAEELEVGVAELRDGSHAASGTATGESVRSAAGHLLGGQDGQVVGADGGVGLDHLGGAESPARAAGSLILDRGDGSLLPPVNRGGQVLGSLHSQTFHAGGGHHGGLLVAAHVESVKLGLGEVTELVDSHLPGGSGLVVLFILLQVLREDVKSSLMLRPSIRNVWRDSNKISVVLPGMVLLSKLLLKLSKPHLIISEAGGEAEGHQGGEDDEKFHVWVSLGHCA